MKAVPFILCGCAAMSWTAGARAEAKVPHHEIELVLDPASGRLQVEDRIRLLGGGDLRLELPKGLSFQQILLNGTPHHLSGDGGQILDLDIRGSDQHEVVLSYGGHLAAPADLEQLSPTIFTEGAFLPYGIGWLAELKGQPFLTYRLDLEVPLPNKVVATGSLAQETSDSGHYRATFATGRPSEPPSVFAGVFDIAEQHHNGIRLRTYFPLEQAALAPVYLRQAEAYLKRFQEQIGRYPHDGFAVVASPLPVGLGFPGLTYVSSRILGMPFMQTRSLAHEILHNWWANGVLVDYEAGNWAEGLTTYMADYALTADAGQDEAAAMRLAWLRDMAALPTALDRPVTSFRSKDHDTDQVVGYHKTAMIFHMLERQIGALAFQAGIRDFWQRQQFRIASWSDLEASFKAASKQDLSAFFDQWLNRQGAPRIAVERVDVAPLNGGFELVVGLRQDKPTYHLELPVRVRSSQGSELHKVIMDDALQSFRLLVKQKPVEVAIDPAHDLFRHLVEGEAPAVQRDVTFSPDAAVVVAHGGDLNAEQVAGELAAAMLEAPFDTLDANDAEKSMAPLLVIGLDHALVSVLDTLSIAYPKELVDRGTARAWAAKRGNGQPILVVSAADSASLEAVRRPLPHYGSVSYLVFEGSKAIDRGVWPAGDSELVVKLD